MSTNVRLRKNPLALYATANLISDLETVVKLFYAFSIFAGFAVLAFAIAQGVGVI